MNTERSGFDSIQLANLYRERIVRSQTREVFLSKIPQADVEGSTHAYINCDGYGMVRRSTTQRSDWPDIDILPNLVPQKLGITREEAETTQIFRLGACNFRCWYCFVDFRYLKASPEHGDLISVEKMVDLYQAQEYPPKIIYLTGGQPDLAPEWTLWMMEELEKRDLDDKVFLWQDDNLSSTALWDHLTPEQIQKMAHYPLYARATCLKGISPETFAPNTGANGRFFDLQIETLSRLVREGFDIYTYLTLLSPNLDHAKTTLPLLMDRLREEVHPLMPLRIFPSKVVAFDQTTKRMDNSNRAMLVNQKDLLEIWNEELANRYTQAEIATHPTNIALTHVR